MTDIRKLLTDFVNQAKTDNLKTALYPKELNGLQLKISFGMGMPARVPWISFLAPEMLTSNGIYPVYLYYKDLNKLILAYGLSESNESALSWPPEIASTAQTISAYFDTNVPRYGDSYIFKVYSINQTTEGVEFNYSNNETASVVDLQSDLNSIIEYYKKVTLLPENKLAVEEVNQGLFYMEKQLEDFIIFNWPKTELGKKYELLIEEGVLLSQQYKTDIGPIDILAYDKKASSYVVIELKRGQTSDDTVGQLARYMSWIKKHKKDNNVRGVIIAGQYDKKLDYAKEMIPNVEVYIYKVDFNLTEFK